MPVCSKLIYDSKDIFGFVQKKTKTCSEKKSKNCVLFQGEEQTNRAGWRECGDKSHDCDQDHCYLESVQNANQNWIKIFWNRIWEQEFGQQTIG